jgi:hypothetical protein
MNTTSHAQQELLKQRKIYVIDSEEAGTLKSLTFGSDPTAQIKGYIHTATKRNATLRNAADSGLSGVTAAPNSTTYGGLLKMGVHSSNQYSNLGAQSPLKESLLNPRSIMGNTSSSLTPPGGAAIPSLFSNDMILAARGT